MYFEHIMTTITIISTIVKLGKIVYNKYQLSRLLLDAI